MGHVKRSFSLFDGIKSHIRIILWLLFAPPRDLRHRFFRINGVDMHICEISLARQLGFINVESCITVPGVLSKAGEKSTHPTSIAL